MERYLAQPQMYNTAAVTVEVKVHAMIFSPFLDLRVPWFLPEHTNILVETIWDI